MYKMHKKVGGGGGEGVKKKLRKPGLILPGKRGENF